MSPERQRVCRYSSPCVNPPITEWHDVFDYEINKCPEITHAVPQVA